MSTNSRFGEKSLKEIDLEIRKSIPANTVRTKSSIWNQFTSFCEERNYSLTRETTINTVAEILTDWAFNMKKANGDDYKEGCIKTLWNTTAKLLQERYFNEFCISFDPFSDIRFKKARDARDSKRRRLQENPNKRKESARALQLDDVHQMACAWDENNPEGLQKKFFHICAFELAWRGNEAANCKVHFFKEEIDSAGKFTGRVEYNPTFSKTTQGGSKQCANSKWLIPNLTNENLCPVRLFKKLVEKRSPNIQSDRLFLTVHPKWEKGVWFKNMPLGINSMSKWTKISAEKIGLETKKLKISNHSHRSAAVSTLAKKGVGEQQLIKLTGHSSVHSVKPYLQIDPEHHSNLVSSLRSTNENYNTASTSVSVAKEVSNNPTSVTYHNCTFHIINNNV